MQLPTAEEFFLNSFFSDAISQEDKKLWLVTNDQALELLNIMIEFAKLHCEAQLKAILEKSTIETKCYQFGDMDEYHVINKDSIIKAYPLTNIK